jgi:hypothetical protein
MLSLSLSLLLQLPIPIQAAAESMNEKWPSRKPDLPAVPTYLYKQDTDKKGLRPLDFSRRVHPSLYADDAASKDRLSLRQSSSSLDLPCLFTSERKRNEAE